MTRTVPTPTAPRRTARPAVRTAVLALCLAGLATAALPGPAQAATVSQGSVVSAATKRTPNVENGAVYEITQAGGRTFLGGTFTSATSAGATTAVARQRVLSFDANGVIDPAFAPQLDGTVNALLPGPVAGTVYVGGAFSTVNGVAARKLLLLSTATGAPVPGFQAPALNGMVTDVKRVGNRLYVGGTFTKAGTLTRTGLVALNATTGALDAAALGFTLAGNHNWTASSAPGDVKAPVGVTKLDVDPTGTHLAVIGNFKTVDGTDRDQVFLADISGATATLADWQTDRYDDRCYGNAYDSWVRDVDFAPDGSYFVVASTGGYPGNGTVCDGAARWETRATGAHLQPTWVSSTGGDTLLSVAVTDVAVYVGGHQRWLNNGLASDYAGPGAVARPGLGALDPLTGLPLAWNPGRNPRGVGAGALYVAPDGLYVGSDTNLVGVGKTLVTRKKIALFPLAGGSARTSTAVPVLPGTVYQAGGAGRYGVLHRINEGGPTVGSVDAGPDWVGDGDADAPALRNSGSNTAGWSPVRDAGAVPAGTPSALFDSERWDPSGGDETTFHLPVPTTTPLTVRLYFANRYSGTSQPGQRVFDVALDGSTVLPAYDIAAKVGDQTGTYEQFQVPAEADGSVDLVFSHHGADNPLVNGIEVLDSSAPAVPASAPDTLTARSFDGTTGGAPSSPVSPVAWGSVRGAFVSGGSLYYGSLTDHALHKRALDGSSDVALDPYHDATWRDVKTGSGQTYAGVAPDLFSSLSDVTSMFAANGRLYYTLAGSSSLLSRGFSTDSGIVGDRATVADSSRDWSDTRGAFLSGSTLYVADRSGTLSAAPWADATPLAGQPAPGHLAGPLGVVSATGDWGGRAMWLVG